MQRCAAVERGSLTFDSRSIAARTAAETTAWTAAQPAAQTAAQAAAETAAETAAWTDRAMCPRAPRRVGRLMPDA